MENGQAIKRKTGLSVVLFYGALFIFLTLILVNAPLISDDFEFADLALTDPGDLLSYVLYYGNGRLLGNLTGIFLINFPILCAMFKAATFCGIIYMLPKMITTPTKNRTFMISLVSLFILGANPNIMGQVFTWTSGWANFVPSILIGMICIHIIRKQPRFSAGYACVIAVLGFAGQLYVEHATAIQLLISGCLVFYYRKHRRSTQLRYALCWLIAGICGAMLMFTLPRIFYLDINRTTGYRTFHFPDLISNGTNACIFILSTLGGCTALLSVFSAFGFLVNAGKTPKAIIKKAVYCVYPVFAAVYPYLDGLPLSRGLFTIARHGMTFLYLLLLVIDIFRMKDKKKKRLMLWLFTVAAISLAPFFVITPFGERCMYLAYVLLSIAALIGMEYCIENGMLIYPKRLRCICAAATVIVCALLGISFAKIHHYDALRDAYIREQIAAGSKKIVVFDLPTKYTFDTYLIDRYYYETVPCDVQFEIVELEEWLQVYNSEQ